MSQPKELSSGDSTHDIINPLPREKFIETIEAKFGPIPEFPRSISTEEFNLQSKEEMEEGKFRKIGYRYDYDPDTEHLRFTNVTFGETPSETIDYVLLDKESQTVARRALRYRINHDFDANTSEVTSDLSTVNLDYRMPQFSQGYSLTYARSRDVVESASVNFELSKDFSLFPVGLNELATIRYGRYGDGKRIDIQIPLATLHEIRQVVNSGEFDNKSRNEVHIYVQEGVTGRKKEEIIHLAIRDALEKFHTLSSGIPFRKKVIAPNTIIVTHGEKMYQVRIDKASENAETWEVTTPDFPDLSDLSEHIKADSWTQTFESFPVRLNIIDPNKAISESQKKLQNPSENVD